MITDIKNLKAMIAELCNLFDYDRVYLDNDMRVSNHWNGELKGFFNDGCVIVYCQDYSTDWDDCVPLATLHGGFELKSRGCTFKFSKAECEKFIENFEQYYNKHTEQKQRELHELHKANDKQMRQDFNNVVNYWYDRLRLWYMSDTRKGTSAEYAKYKAIEKAVQQDWHDNFVDLCKLTSEERVMRWREVALKVA